mgnify:CR=1 FL=1
MTAEFPATGVGAGLAGDESARLNQYLQSKRLEQRYEFGCVLGRCQEILALGRTPPFGFALFYLRGVASDEISTRDIYKGALPFVGLQVAVLALIIAVPGVVEWLPLLAGAITPGPLT